MEQNITIDDTMITITWWSSEENSHTYDFTVESLNRLMVVEINSKTINLSETIAHIGLKSWVELDTLYRLTQITKEKFPENKIDWLETFKYIKK